MLRRLVLSTLAILFISSSLWAKTPQPEIRTGIWRGTKITYLWYPGTNGSGKAIYQGDILLESVQDKPNPPGQNSVGIAFPNISGPKWGTSIKSHTPSTPSPET